MGDGSCRIRLDFTRSLALFLVPGPVSGTSRCWNHVSNWRILVAEAFTIHYGGLSSCAHEAFLL